ELLARLRRARPGPARRAVREAQRGDPRVLRGQARRLPRARRLWRRGLGEAHAVPALRTAKRVAPQHRQGIVPAHVDPATRGLSRSVEPRATEDADAFEDSSVEPFAAERGGARLARALDLHDVGRALRDFAAYLPAQLIPALAGFLALPILARALTPGQLGDL